MRGDSEERLSGPVLDVVLWYRYDRLSGRRFAFEGAEGR